MSYSSRLQQNSNYIVRPEAYYKFSNSHMHTFNTTSNFSGQSSSHKFMNYQTSPEDTRRNRTKGTLAMHWQFFLLRYGAHSEQLRDAVAKLAGHLALYTIVHWDDIRALMSSRLLALDKCPGACPRGRGGAPENP